MKITSRGIILALKDVGSWLASYTVMGIRADPLQFVYSLLVFCFITIPSDLYMLNHWSDTDKSAGYDKAVREIRE